jgi:hypothetical protein
LGFGDVIEEMLKAAVFWDTHRVYWYIGRRIRQHLLSSQYGLNKYKLVILMKTTNKDKGFP